MRWLTTRNIVWTAKAAWFVIAASFTLAYTLWRFLGRRIGAGIAKSSDSFPCAGCGEEVSLVGLWECGRCGYVFDGWFLARCVLCGAVPPYVKGQACGVSVKNPMIFP